jgi:hypothetical protein
MHDDQAGALKEMIFRLDADVRAMAWKPESKCMPMAILYQKI